MEKQTISVAYCNMDFLFNSQQFYCCPKPHQNKLIYLFLNCVSGGVTEIRNIRSHGVTGGCLLPHVSWEPYSGPL